MIVSSIPFGFLLSELLSKIVLTRRDSYFQNSVNTQIKIEILLAVQSFMMLVCGITGFVVRATTPGAVKEEIKEKSAESPHIKILEGLKVIFKEEKKALIIIASIAFYIGAYYLQLLKWPHIANQFHFTQVMPMFLKLRLVRWRTFPNLLPAWLTLRSDIRHLWLAARFRY